MKNLGEEKQFQGCQNSVVQSVAGFVVDVCRCKFILYCGMAGHVHMLNKQGFTSHLQDKSTSVFSLLCVT